jgi:hypothetical protein
MQFDKESPIKSKLSRSNTIADLNMELQAGDTLRKVPIVNTGGTFGM